ncbi:nuclear transport factor 2 family protein [Actinoplanes oblitus]|uniref:Nuclear transport factor 2 family protein n=1 Tax=Actinoplanes oblitus TaxID=3040509 RepID=A0ABY8WLL1_9ACTN|nr:nuclear transport factor 2 family protein [Actinoplanes oblitus]WIM98749.1 nuclear transport factor 2 family protein [Actinoplanes oblitus]
MTVTTAFDMSAAFQELVNGRDLDGLLDLFGPGAVSRTVGGEVLTDPDRIRADLAGLLAGNPHLVNTPRHTLVSGDVALMLIDWTLEVDTPDGRAQLAGTTTNVVRQTLDGGWRFAVLNPAGTAA